MTATICEATDSPTVSACAFYAAMRTHNLYGELAELQLLNCTNQWDEGRRQQFVNAMVSLRHAAEAFADLSAGSEPRARLHCNRGRDVRDNR
jgi:hypothetical protein